MPRKAASTALVPPRVTRETREIRVINLYLYTDDVTALDTIASQMDGTRSDAIRWMLSVVNGKSDKKSTPLS